MCGYKSEFLARELANLFYSWYCGTSRRSAPPRSPRPFVHRGDSEGNEPRFANEHPRFRCDPRIHGGFLKELYVSLFLFLSLARFLSLSLFRFTATLTLRFVRWFRFVCSNALKQHRCPLCSDDAVVRTSGWLLVAALEHLSWYTILPEYDSLSRRCSLLFF